MHTITPAHIMEQVKLLGYDPKFQKETNQVYFIFKHENYEFPLFIRPIHQNDFLQLVAFLPCSFKRECLHDLCRFLLMINKELDMPGFCIDESSKTIFYRLLLPSVNNEIPSELLAIFLNSAQSICKTFCKVIDAIGNGLMSLDETLEKAKIGAQQSSTR